MGETRRSGGSKRAKRWSAAEAREVMERWRGSGQSAASFAAQNRLSASRLSYWSKQLELQGSGDAPQFVAVAVPTPASASHAVEIAVGELTLRVREGADPGFVVQLVVALQRRSGQPC